MKATAKRAVTAFMADVRATETPQDGAASVAERDIARRAYALYLARGCEDGHDVRGLAAH
jgi:hypothetical protein